MFKYIKDHMHTPAVEAVRFTAGPSNLFTEMTSLCQAVFNALPKDILDLSIEECLAAVDVALDVSLFESSVIDLVKKELGYNLVELIRCNDDVAIQLGVHLAIRVPELKKYQPYVKVKKINAAATAQVSTIIKRIYSEDTGAFMAPKDLNASFPAKLYYSNSLWIVKKLWPEYDLTAENIAAAFLHEFGHIAAFIHDMIKMVEFNDIKTDIIDYSKTVRTKDDMLKSLTSYEESLNVVEGTLNTVLPTEYVKTFAPEFKVYRKGIASCRAHVTKSGVTEDTMAEFYYIAFTLAHYLDCLGILSLRTVSDTFITPLYKTRGERTADEFSARYGATRALTEALITLTGISTTYRDESYVDIDYSWKVAAIKLLNINTSLLKLSECVISSSYDPFKERLRQIIETTNSALKHKPLAPHMRDYYIQQIQESQKLLDEYSNQRYVKVREALFSITERIGSIGKSPLTVFLSKLEHQYKPLQDWTASLIRNNLAYQSSRIDRLIS